MTGFWHKFIQHNAPFISRTLRKLADEVDAIAPGSPLFGFVMFKSNKEFIMGQITVPDNNEPLNATVTFVDAEGSPTTPDDTPAWSSSDENVAVVSASPDGLSASVSIGSPGATVISVTSTNTDGSSATATGTITVEPGDAVLGSVEFAQPEAPVV